MLLCDFIRHKHFGQIEMSITEFICVRPFELDREKTKKKSGD